MARRPPSFRPRPRRAMQRTIFALLALALAGPVAAQERTEFLGRVVAVIGDSIVTNIDLQEALLAWQATTGQPLPQDAAALTEIQREVLNDRIDQLLLLQAAQRDTSLRVPDAQVRLTVDENIRRLEQQFGGPAGFERALAESNLTRQSYRERMMAQQRRELLIARYVQLLRQQRKPPTVTEEEIRAYFEANRDRIGQRPPTITFRQVVIPIEASDSAIERTRLKADSILQLARAGEDFAQLARRFSEDPGSRDLGGDLGYNRFETWYTEFSAAAFSPLLRPGEIVGPVRTPVGFHIIKLERVRGPERQVRHILLRPEITAADRSRARQRGDSIATAVRSGAIVDSLAARYSDPEELVRVGPWRQDSLPTPYNQHLTTAREGDVIGPFEVDPDGPEPQLAVVRVTATEPARPASVDDYRVQIQQQIAQGKLMQEILDELRRATYIDVRLPAASAVGATR